MNSSDPVHGCIPKSWAFVLYPFDVHNRGTHNHVVRIWTPNFLGNLRCCLAYVPSTTRQKIDPLTHSALAVGSLSIPLARLGAKVASSDISAAMTGEAKERAKVGKSVQFHFRDGLCYICACRGLGSCCPLRCVRIVWNTERCSSGRYLLCLIFWQLT